MKSIKLFLFATVLIIVCYLSAICQSVTTGYVSIEGRKVYYEVKGQGPAIVLIHGFSLDARMWDFQFDAFAQSHRVVRYDISGYGRSTIPDTSISGVNELASLLKFLGIEKATVLGMSMGGGLAINFTLEHPEMVNALVTVGSVLGGFRMREPGPSTRLERIISISKDLGLDEAKDTWMDDPLLTPVADTARIQEIIRRIVTEWSGIQFVKPSMANFLPVRPSAIRRLEQIHVPTLALVGDRDDPNMIAVADTLAARIPGARRVIVPGASHLLNLERPNEFNKIVLDFLTDVEKR
jgi:pimeloyl-ACP methyl ester carboxylesterase